MKKAFFFLLGMLSVGLLRAQSDYAVSQIPDSLKARANAVVRAELLTVDMQSYNKVSYQMKQVITVFNKSGEDKARLVLFYDKNTSIKAVKGQVFDADGVVIGKVSLKNFSDESAVSHYSLYDDSRVKHFLPSVSIYPYTVEYEYEVLFKQNLIIPDWRPLAHPDVAIEYSQYTFLKNSVDEVNIKTLNYDGPPRMATIDGRETFTWTLAAVPAKRREPFSPAPETYQPTVKIAPVQFYYYKNKGKNNDWNALGKWVYDELLQDAYNLSEETKKNIRNLVSDVQTDEEKVRKLYRYMQEKTRYVSVQIGIGGFKPMPAADVHRLGYGDCKALVAYMQNLLMAVDIPSQYCVVYGGDAKRDMLSDFSSMSQGNHVILCVPLGRDTTWLECTSSLMPFGFLGSFTDDRVVLACTPEGGKLLRTPAFDAKTSSQTRQAGLTLSAVGGLSGKLTTLFAGGQYDNHLQISTASGREQVRLLRDSYNIDNISFAEVNYQADETLPAINESIHVEIPHYAPKNAEGMYFVPNVFTKGRTVPVLKHRTLPLYINRGYVDEDTITYSLVSGMKVASGSLSEFIETPFGEYSMRISQEGDTLTYYRKFLLHEGTYPAAAYAAFADFMNRVNAVDNAKIVLK